MYLCKATEVCLSLSKTELCIATGQSTQKIDSLGKESPKEDLQMGKGGCGWRRTKQ